MDEKAFQAAMRVWSPNWPPFEPTERHLRKVFTAYEQARERVAFEVTEEEWEAFQRKLTMYAAPTNGLHLLNAVLGARALRPAPSAQPWTRDQLIAVYMDAFPTMFGRRYDIEQGGGASRDIDRIVASLNKLFGPTAPVASAPARSFEEAFAATGCMYGEDALEQVRMGWDLATGGPRAVPVASAQPRMHSEECDEHLMQLERDLAAERAAHQATKAGLDEAIARADRLEAKASQLTDMLHAERAAHEATRAELANAANALPPIVHPLLREIKLGLVGVQSAVDPNDRLNRIGVVRNLVSQAIVLSRGKEQAGQAWDSCIESRLLAAIEAAESAALERDLNATEARRLIGIRNDLLEAAENRAAELERELAEARAKLGALREWAERAIRVDTSEGYVFAARDVTNLIDPKPGDLRRVVDAESGEAFLVDAQGRVARYTELSHSEQVEIAMKNCTRYPQEPAEPKPGDVLSGEETKAYMLANPGRRVRLKGENIEYVARDGGVYCLMDGSRGNDFSSGVYRRHEYIVLPPEPSNPATPDLDLAGRVAVLERQVTALIALEARPRLNELEAWQKLKALEGGGSPAKPEEPRARNLYKPAHDPATGERIYVRKTAEELAAEDAKPATPDIDLAGRVGRLEKFARHVLEAFGKLTTEHGDGVATVFGDTSLADALKALEGGGSQ